MILGELSTHTYTNTVKFDVLDGPIGFAALRHILLRIAQEIYAPVNVKNSKF